MKPLTSQIKQLASSCGYLDCGIAHAEPFDLLAGELERRQRLFPESAHLYQNMENRIDPKRTAPWTRSIITAVRSYGKYRLPQQAVGHIGRNYLADRRVPQSPDYQMPHRFTEELKKLGLRVKRGGVPERLAGARAGVVSIGRNNFAYHPAAGSWINLESWRIDAELAPDAPNYSCPCPDNCQACVKNCPTGALRAPYEMRFDHCIAYLTYRAPRPISSKLASKMRGWIYGCDDCQTACPLNRNKWCSKKSAPWLEKIAHLLTPEALMKMDESTFKECIFPLFWYIPEEEAGRWRENAERALRNQERSEE